MILVSRLLILGELCFCFSRGVHWNDYCGMLRC